MLFTIQSIGDDKYGQTGFNTAVLAMWNGRVYDAMTTLAVAYVEFVGSDEGTVVDKLETIGKNKFGSEEFSGATAKEISNGQNA